MSAGQGARPDWTSLFGRRTHGIRLGLEAVQGVFEALGRPAADAVAVHVVGTNGKGSVAAMLAHALSRVDARRPIGRYTSPHLHRVSERVVVDGTPVDEHALWAAVQTVDAAERDQPPPRPLSFFEVLTLAALVSFERAGACTLVVEAGLGGRLDATRLVSPAVVAVTSIALDHQQWLGDTLEAIAGEKAAVFRTGVPVISAPQEPAVEAVLRRAADGVGAELRFATPLARAPLFGSHQRINAAVALEALRVLEPEANATWLEGVTWPGRLEVVPASPASPGTLVLDVAHNPAAMHAVVDALVEPDAGLPRPDRIVVGVQADKDRAGVQAALDRLAVPITWVDVDDPQAADTVHAFTDRGDTVLVCGSHVLVARVRTGRTPLEGPDPSDPRSFGGTDPAR